MGWSGREQPNILTYVDKLFWANLPLIEKSLEFARTILTLL